MKKNERKIREGLKDLNSTVKLDYIKMLMYYKIHDMLHGTQHTEILHILYECEHNFTFDGIALHCHISRRTLDRNRKEYLECFMACRSMETVLSEAAVIASN